MTRHGNVILAIVLAGLAAVPGGLAAGASDTRPAVTHLYGSLGETGRVHERVSIVERRRGRYRVFKFVFKEIPLTCEDGSPATYEIRDTQSTPVSSSPRFGWGAGGAVVTLSIDGGPEPQYSWEMEVEVQGRQSASGTLRVRGDDLDVGDSAPQSCRSGPLTWSTRPRT